MSNAILQVDGLSVAFKGQSGLQQQSKTVLEGFSFELNKGETVALVGESGSGKTTVALSILQLLPYPQAYHPSGSIVFNGEQLLGADAQTMSRIRGNDISMIFQEPMTSLNPLHVIKKQISESLALHQGLSGEQADQQAISLLEKVGIDHPASRLESYPHQLSGGQRQRVMIAMALANKPQLLLADEPTTALDVTVQAQILELLKQLQKTDQLGLMLVSHDLQLVRRVADRVLVLKQGKLVEQGVSEQIFISPQQPYTKNLIAAEPPTKQHVPNTNRCTLEAEQVRVYFPIKRGWLRKTKGYIKAVDDVSLQLSPGQTLGLVGESGSGKTTLALALLKLIRFQGKILLNGQSIMDEVDSGELRRSIQMVFQDPYGSLSPRMSITDIVSEGLDVTGRITDRQQRDEKVIDILKQVEIDPQERFRYPHEFSGGQRQRIAIARALILNPSILILDEPTSSLDRTVQVQILRLLNDLQARHQLAYIFISHDLSVVRAIADQVLVMKSGKLVEQGDAKTIFAEPQHPYTQKLLNAAFNFSGLSSS